MKEHDFSKVNTPIMTGTMWKEFGKMYNAIVSEGYELVLENTYHDGEMFYTASAFSPYGEHLQDSEECLNPYCALKELYFTGFLGYQEWEDVPLELDPYILDELYKAADKEGITIDEYVINALREVLAALKGE